MSKKIFNRFVKFALYVQRNILGLKKKLEHVNSELAYHGENSLHTERTIFPFIIYITTENNKILHLNFSSHFDNFKEFAFSKFDGIISLSFMEGSILRHVVHESKSYEKLVFSYNFTTHSVFTHSD